MWKTSPQSSPWPFVSHPFAMSLFKAGAQHPTQHAAFRRLMCRISAPSSRSHGNQTQHHYWYFPYDHAISPLPRERSHVATEGLQARGQAALRGALEQSEQQISGSASGKPDVVVGMA